MPNTKRRFADDDPESGDEVNHQPVYRGGGKQFGKQLQRPPPMDDSDDDDDDDDESDYDEPVAPRGGGKHFRPGGKQLRVMDHQESDEDDDDDEPVRPVARGGGKSLFYPPPQDDSDEDEEEDEPTPVQHRGGGKSLMGMQQRGGGKQLRPPPPQEQEEDDDDDDEDSDDLFEEETPMVVTRAPHGGGKQLRRPAPKSDSDDDDDLFDEDEDMDIEDSSEEEEVVEKPAPKPRGRPKGKTAPKKTPARTAKKKAQDDMDESSSEEELELDMETFDTQALVESEEDKKYLDSLPEFEREAILGERFEKLKAAADMKKALRESKRKEREAQKMEESAKKKTAKSKAKEKKADTDGDAEIGAKLSSVRESTRNRDALGTKAKKDAARAEMRKQRQSVVQQREDDDEEESDLEFESDEDSDEDYEDSTLKPWQKKKAIKTSSRLDRAEEPSSDEEIAEPGKERAPPVAAELEDYIRVTLPRRRLARWCHEPYFDRAVIGCFVRLFIGESEDGKKCYRLCEIVDVDKSKSEYKFPVASSKEKPISTSKALKLRFGKNEKVFPMYLVSDSRPTDEDVKKYESVQKSSCQDVLRKREALRLRKKQDELVNNYTYTEADIAMNVAERKKTGKAPKNLGLEQTRVAIAVQAAQSAVDDAQRKVDDAKRAYLEASENDSDELEKAMEEAQTALDEAKSNLEEKKDEEQRLLAIVKRRKEKLTRRQNWQKVNERAAKMNQTADFQSYKDQQAKKEAESMSGSAPRFNPYARRRVKPKILWEVGQKEEKKDDDATKTSDNEARDEADEAVKAANAKDDQQMTEAPQEDILGSQKLIDDRHQFSIDEEALTPDTTCGHEDINSTNDDEEESHVEERGAEGGSERSKENESKGESGSQKAAKSEPDGKGSTKKRKRGRPRKLPTIRKRARTKQNDGRNAYKQGRSKRNAPKTEEERQSPFFNQEPTCGIITLPTDFAETPSESWSDPIDKALSPNVLGWHPFDLTFLNGVKEEEKEIITDFKRNPKPIVIHVGDEITMLMAGDSNKQIFTVYAFDRRQMFCIGNKILLPSHFTNCGGNIRILCPAKNEYVTICANDIRDVFVFNSLSESVKVLYDHQKELRRCGSRPSPHEDKDEDNAATVLSCIYNIECDHATKLLAEKDPEISIEDMEAEHWLTMERKVLAKNLNKEEDDYGWYVRKDGTPDQLCPICNHLVEKTGGYECRWWLINSAFNGTERAKAPGSAFFSHAVTEHEPLWMSVPDIRIEKKTPMDFTLYLQICLEVALQNVPLKYENTLNDNMLPIALTGIFGFAMGFNMSKVFVTKFQERELRNIFATEANTVLLKLSCCFSEKIVKFKQSVDIQPMPFWNHLCLFFQRGLMYHPPFPLIADIEIPNLGVLTRKESDSKKSSNSRHSSTGQIGEDMAISKTEQTGEDMAIAKTKQTTASV